MRNYITLVCIFLCFFSLDAQYFEGGVLFGITVSQIDGDSQSGYHQPGLTAGAYTAREFKNIKGVIELKYTAKGAREGKNSDGLYLYEQKLRYIELPLKMRYYIEGIQSSVETGISPGYLFYDKDADGRDNNNNKFELSWLVGIHYHLMEPLTFSVQFNYSILTIYRHEVPDSNMGPIPRLLNLNNGDFNNVIQFMVYYQLGRK